MSQNKPTTSAPEQNSRVSSLKALEGAAIRKLTAMLKEKQGKMPDEKSVVIAAKLMARKAHRWLLEREKAST